MSTSEEKKQKFVFEIVIRESDRTDPCFFRCETLRESVDLFLLFACFSNTLKSEGGTPIAADFREAQRLKELAKEHSHPSQPCYLLPNGEYTCGEKA